MIDHYVLHHILTSKYALTDFGKTHARVADFTDRESDALHHRARGRELVVFYFDPLFQGRQ